MLCVLGSLFSIVLASCMQAEETQRRIKLVQGGSAPSSFIFSLTLVWRCLRLASNPHSDHVPNTPTHQDELARAKGAVLEAEKSLKLKDLDCLKFLIHTQLYPMLNPGRAGARQGGGA